MFQSIKKATETKLAFSAITDVTVDGSETEKADSMEVCNPTSSTPLSLLIC